MDNLSEFLKQALEHGEELLAAGNHRLNMRLVYKHKGKICEMCIGGMYWAKFHDKDYYMPRALYPECVQEQEIDNIIWALDSLRCGELNEALRIVFLEEADKIQDTDFFEKFDKFRSKFMQDLKGIGIPFCENQKNIMHYEWSKVAVSILQGMGL